MNNYSDSTKPTVERDLETENDQLRLHLAELVRVAESVSYATLGDFFQAVERAKEVLGVEC